MKSRLRLFHYWRSSASWRVRFGFAVKGIEAELVAVNLLKEESDQPAHRARNPMGYVPALEFLDPAPDRPRFLAESMAILEWAEECLGGPKLLPADPVLRA